MDPHSRLSQFNQRAPKSGPKSVNYRFADLMAQPKHSVDKRSSTMPKKPSPSASSPLLIQRPIATNSRVKQDEKYRKDMYLAFVNNALQQKSRGISDTFDELVNQFNLKLSQAQGVPQLIQLRLWISALSHVVSRLERTHSVLVDAIVNMSWTTLDTATVKSYTIFMGMLVSARPEYLSLVLGKIAQGFTHQSGIQALEAGMPEGSASPLTRRVIYDRLHYLLQHLISLIPTLSSTLQPLLVRSFPHKRQSLVAQTTYIRNLLRISAYCPELADKILATIIDRTIQIDVEIQVELEELEEEEAAQDQDVFELDPFDTVVGQEEADTDSDADDESEGDNLSDLSSEGGDMNDEARPFELPTNVVHIQDMVKKLDAILTLIFDHFHRAHTSMATLGTLPSALPHLPPLPSSTPRSSPLSTPIPSHLEPYADEQLISVTGTPPLLPSTTPSQSGTVDCSKNFLRTQFHTLLSIFDRTILRTFKSRYTQFLIFWYASLDPEFSDVFQGMLVDRALFETSPDSTTQNNTPTVTRAAAASYLGSFVSRATFVDREGVRRVVAVLCEFLRAHLEAVEDGDSEGGYGLTGIAHNTVFYAVTQAVFLIFCFRWRDLLEEEDEDELLVGRGGKKWMPQLNVLQRVVTSILNPLQVCSPNVVMQFARVAHATDFIYCYTILESNKRSEDRRVIPSVTSTQTRSLSTGIRLMIGGGSINAELNTFFPFDPYRLPKSNVYIQCVYREWSTVAIDDEDDEEEEEFGDGERSDISSQWKIPQSSNYGSEEVLGESLGKMSISPIWPPVSYAHPSGHA